MSNSEDNDRLLPPERQTLKRRDVDPNWVIGSTGDTYLEALWFSHGADLMQNTPRGKVIETQLAQHVFGVEPLALWADWDFEWRGLRVGVKTTALFQDWPAPRSQGKYPVFSSPFKKGGSVLVDVEVFAAHKATSLADFDLRSTLDIADYDYYVVPRYHLVEVVLPRIKRRVTSLTKAKIRLEHLRPFAEPLSIQDLCSVVLKRGRMYADTTEMEEARTLFNLPKD